MWQHSTVWMAPFLGDVEDRKWFEWGGGLVACPNSVSPPHFPCHVSHCGMCYPMGLFDTEWCVQAKENEGLSQRQSERQVKGWAMYVPLCTVALTDVYKLPSDGGSGSSHINHFHCGVPRFQSSSVALTGCFSPLSLQAKDHFSLFLNRKIFSKDRKILLCFFSSCCSLWDFSGCCFFFLFPLLQSF